MDSLQASYRDDDDEEEPPQLPPTPPQNDDAQETQLQNDVEEDRIAKEPESSPKDDAVLEPESLNDTAQEAHHGPLPQPEPVVPVSVTENAAQEPASRNDVPLEVEAQREPMVSDSVTENATAQGPEPPNDVAQEALPEPVPMVTDSVSEEEAEEAETQNGAVREAQPDIQPESMISESVSEDDPTASDDTQKSPKPDNIAAQNDDVEEEDDEDDDPPPKKQKPLSSLTTLHEQQAREQQQHTSVANNNSVSKTNLAPSSGTATKKSKKKNNNVWVSRTTRKGKKKNKTNTQKEVSPEDTVLITPVPRFPDKGDDNPEMKICLSKVYKAEKVELSEDRLTAGSTKGYRMVRATRGVVEGAWYYEIKVVALGETGHTRLGWSTEKGDLQAPVGYDGNSFGYRDIDGSKVHKALREKYGEEGYKEGDVIGFYINLPEGGQYAPKPPHFVWYKGQRYVCAPDSKEDPPKVVPGSEISFFKNGVCQGVAFKDLYGGRYYPAASMYSLPNQPNCVVKFNFGPDFECCPEDFGERPVPSPMVEVSYHGFDSRIETGVSNEKKY